MSGHLLGNSCSLGLPYLFISDLYCFFLPGLEVINLKLKFILLIYVEMPTIVGILTFISWINHRLSL